MAAANRFSIEAVVRTVDKVTAPMSRMANGVAKSTRKMGAAVGRLNARFMKLGKSVGPALGVAGVAGGFLAVKMAMGAVISTGADLEQTLVGAGARFEQPIRRGTAAFKELEDIARDVGARTEFTATAAAEGLNFMAKAGFNAAQSMALLPGLVDLATASETDLARATDIASDSIGAFGMMTEDATQLQANFEKISDSMATTVNSTNTNMEQLFETIRKGAPAATAAGVPMNTFLALTGRLANAGLKASDAGTALKNIFLKLTDKGVIRSLERMGVAVTDIETGELRDFADIMDDLIESTSDKSKVQRAGIINQLFGLRGITGVATILGEGTDAFRKLRDGIDASAGSTGRLARIMRDTLTGDIKQLNSATESLTITFFKANDEGIEAFTESLTKGVRAVDDFTKQNPALAKTVLIVGGLAAAFVGIGLVVAGIAAAIGFIVASPVALAAALAAITISLATFLATDKDARDTAASFLPTLLFKALELIKGPALGAEQESPIAPTIVSPQQRQQQLQQGEANSMLHQIAMTIRGDTGGVTIDQPNAIPGFSLTLDDSGSLA